MPRERVDGLGIEYDGPALEGEKSVEEARRAGCPARLRRDEEVYENVEDYDPVLRFHCKL